MTDTETDENIYFRIISNTLTSTLKANLNPNLLDSLVQLCLERSNHISSTWHVLALFFFYLMFLAQILAFDKTKRGAVEDFHRIRRHQIHLEAFSQRQLQQLLHKALHVCDLTVCVDDVT